MMRALVMDFANDKQALDINDEFMFGKSLLVNPVTESMYLKAKVRGRDTVDVADFSSVKTKEVYLPDGCGWYDFWTNEKFNGGQSIHKEVPIDIIPLYVKSGSILPIGPKVQYATEKSWDNLEIRVYAGDDGMFTLYEDENDNYNYEKGVYSTIQFSWNESDRELVIGEREGSFPGMLKERTFKVVLVSDAKGREADLTAVADKVVKYEGNKLVVRF